ncbi:serine protease [Congregibacter brevis]|uniref:Serine protease n=1 Tax=Congregibacter brevis TaxID=3081201 RepID=A0ABZ0I9D5_9GAMM|nr:serine protease [Congregibacter sp. IMCC45268]
MLLCAISSAIADDSARPESFARALDSVGKLHVPGQRYENGYAKHYDESCSATLITDDNQSEASQLIISAWHCIEFYHDTSKPLTFETARGETRNANLIASGGSMYSDWALLRLDSPLNSPSVLLVPDNVDAGAGDLLMAGYPRSNTAETKILETAYNCRVTGTDGPDARSDCVLQKGASGGGVFSIAVGSGGKTLQYLGVISRGDGESQSIYVPLKRFHSRIAAYLQSTRRP